MMKGGKKISKTLFGEIKHNKGDTSVKKAVSVIKKAEKSNYSLFKIKPYKFQIEFVYSNEEYDKKTRLKNIKNNWRGMYLVRKDKMVGLSPSIDKRYNIINLFNHEINHFFYLSLIGSYHPTWFSEGMATYLSKYYKNLNRIKWKKYFNSIKNPERFLYYRYIKKKYFKNVNQFYILSYFVFEYLWQKFKKRKIMSLLRAFSKKSSKNNFSKLFIDRFGFTIKDAVGEAIKFEK